MKKAIIIGPAHPLRGGLATFNERLAIEFQNKGYEVTIYTFSLQYPGFLFPGKTQYSDEAAPSDLNIKVVVNSINPFNWVKIGLQLRKLQPNIIVLRYWLPFMAPCLGTIARIAKRKHKTKVIAIADNIIPHEKRIGDSILSSYFTASCDGFITMSKAVLEDLRKFTTSKPGKYYPHPLYDNYGQALDKEAACAFLKLDPSQKYLLFFGFIRDYKGLDLLLEAMADERVKSLQVKLLVAGEFYTASKPYFDLIESLQIQEQVIMHHHFIPNTSIPAYFCAADVVVQPYKDATQSGVTQIAYFFDKPMIITNVGGLAELVPHEVVGYVVSPDKSALATAIVNYYTENKAIKFVENIKTEKKRFSWEGLVKLFETF
jgi:glycosyltransferase involved in cell wall biosynthesis